MRTVQPFSVEYLPNNRLRFWVQDGFHSPHLVIDEGGELRDGEFSIPHITFSDFIEVHVSNDSTIVIDEEVVRNEPLKENSVVIGTPGSR